MGIMNNTNQQMIVQQPIMAQPIVYIPKFGNLQYTFTQDPLSEIALSVKATIRQQPELMEIITGCESENRYHVFITLPNGMEKYLFKCKEESTGCQRFCCTSEIREFNMKIKHIPNIMSFNAPFETYFATLNKPFKCTCCCLARPSIKGEYWSNKQIFGEVKEEFTCCDPLFAISNGKEIKYYITIECCQCSFCCRNAKGCGKECGKINEVECNIREGGIGGNVVGKIRKKIAQNYLELISDADTYVIEFPVTASSEDKLTLIMAGLFIDYRYFETVGSGNYQSRRRGGSRRRH